MAKINWAVSWYPTEDSFVTVGDYNTGCSYVSGTGLATLRTNGLPYLWIVPDALVEIPDADPASTLFLLMHK